MANVKITELTELAQADIADADVFPIVDVGADATKKVTIANLRTNIAAANDFVTYTNITANVDIVQDNVAAGVTEATAIEARRVANIAGAVSTITTGNLDTGRAIISDGSGKVAVSAVTSTEIGYLDGVTSAIQTQIDTKIATTDSAANDFVTFARLDANIDVVSANATAVEARRVANIAGAVSTITTGNLTASRALVSDGSGKVAISPVTSTELGYVDGVTSAIQTQIDSKQATITGAATTIDDTNLTASRALASDGSGKVAVASTTTTELNQLNAITRGSLIYGNASGATARLAAGGADKVLTSDGTDISWEDAAGGGAMGFTTNTTIADPPGTVNTDLGNLTDTDTDAFGVTSQPSYDLMEPFGRTVSLDLGAL